MGIHHLLIFILQILLTGGVGGIIVVGFATKGIFISEQTPAPENHRFVNEYQELMWLAEKQRHRFNVEETRRFYQLRHNWSLMHS
jgi:hypothetical protein